ncbi:riboflavin synthase [bacterium]|nr:riboflavin synthase [bacterium]
MFTGLIEEVGVITAILIKGGNSLLSIKAETVCDDLKLGDSVAINGVCLTVIELKRDGFIVEASSHTVKQCTIHSWQIGRKINLERALAVGDRLGGHIVQGHIDGIGRVAKIRYGEGSTDIHIEAPDSVMKLIAPKGSIAVDGVSLTVAEKTARSFKLMVIPYTLQNTCLGELKPGDNINLETDVVIRWLADRFKDVQLDGKDTSDWLRDQIHLED